MPEPPIVQTGARTAASEAALIRPDGVGSDDVVVGPDPLLEPRNTAEPWRTQADQDALAAESRPAAATPIPAMTRPELDSVAADAGVEEPESLANKSEVVEAIAAATPTPKESMTRAALAEIADAWNVAHEHLPTKAHIVAEIKKAMP